MESVDHGLEMGRSPACPELRALGVWGREV